MATGIWPKNGQQKAPRSFSRFFACFRSFSHHFRTFSLVFAPFGLSVSFLTVLGRPFAHFFAPFASGCHLDSPEIILSPHGNGKALAVARQTHLRVRDPCDGREVGLGYGGLGVQRISPRALTKHREGLMIMIPCARFKIHLQLPGN